MHFIAFLVATSLAIILAVHPNLLAPPPTAYRPRFNISSEDLAISRYGPYSGWVAPFTVVLSNTETAYRDVVHGAGFKNREKIGVLAEEFIWHLALIINDTVALERDVIEAIEQYAPGLTANKDVEASIRALVRRREAPIVGKDRLTRRLRSAISRSRHLMTRVASCTTMLSDLELLAVVSQVDVLQSRARTRLSHIFFTDRSHSREAYAILSALVSATTFAMHGMWVLDDHLIGITVSMEFVLDRWLREAVTVAVAGGP
ncbi:hypothetical protein NM688_g4730 [Phlebia brevispora]|uniref:Uncharacterized protein n=1 Tax=Phlebia brevispora TaxID=194682 RepID=A0ACC1T222_9APHY|nr:hypothetical protein NM688_g4730 [Phlebia brevispora]